MDQTRIVGTHIRATPEGAVRLRVSGSGPAVVTLRSTWRISPRWLGSGGPRNVRFGTCRVALQSGIVTTVGMRLSREHLALLHRMGTIRVTVRLRMDDRVVTQRINLHSPHRW